MLYALLLPHTQIAFDDAVVIVDMLWCMANSSTAHAVDALLAVLLLCPAVLLVGCGVEANDVPRLAQSYPTLRSIQLARQHGLARSLDVQQLPSLLMQGQPPRRPPSLSAVCTAVLGAPLAKQQQRSAWGSRPLTPAQLLYAADDAAVLLELLSKVQSLKRAELLGMLAPLCAVPAVNRNPVEVSPSSRNGQPSAIVTDDAPCEGPTRVPSMHVVVDVPLLLDSWLGRVLPAEGRGGVLQVLTEHGEGPGGPLETAQLRYDCSMTAPCYYANA